MAVRRFQLGANVFEVDVRGSELHVGVGKLNRPTLKPRKKASEAEAKAEMEKLIAAHVAKGYVEVEVPPDPEIARAQLRAEQQKSDALLARIQSQQADAQRAFADKLQRSAFTTKRNPALEEEAERDPHARKVYADWLIEAGDPRGTIAATFLGGDVKAAEQLCADYTPYGHITLDQGFASSAGISGEQLAAKVRVLCSAGVACTVRELRLGLADDGDWTPVVNAIAESPLAGQLRALDFSASDRLERDPDEYSERDQELYERVAPVRFAGAPAWSQLTALERVAIDGPFGGKLGLASPTLRELTIRSSRLHDLTDLLALRKNAPRLERLAVFYPGLDDAARRQLHRAFGKRLVTQGDTLPPARYGAIVE